MVSVASRTKEIELAVFILWTQKAQYVSYYLLQRKNRKMTIEHIQQGAYTGADLRGTFGGGDEQVPVYCTKAV